MLYTVMETLEDGIHCGRLEDRIDYLVAFYSKSNRLSISIFTVSVIDIVADTYWHGRQERDRDRTRHNHDRLGQCEEETSTLPHLRMEVMSKATRMPARSRNYTHAVAGSL